MSDNDKQWFVTERARALALMHLTRRDDLVVTPVGTDIGLEYLVYITRDDEKPSARQFGVALRAARSPAGEEHVNKALRPTMRSYARAGGFPYPVCLFYFTMEDSQGYYPWVVEPVPTSDGKPRLQVHAASCKRLDREALDRIVDQTQAWYGAFSASVVVHA